MQISCWERQFAKKVFLNDQMQNVQKMIHNDVVDLLNGLDLLDKISDEKHRKIYSKHRKKCSLIVNHKQTKSKNMLKMPKKALNKALPLQFPRIRYPHKRIHPRWFSGESPWFNVLRLLLLLLLLLLQADLQHKPRQVPRIQGPRSRLLPFLEVSKFQRYFAKTLIFQWITSNAKTRGGWQLQSLMLYYIVA